MGRGEGKDEGEREVELESLSEQRWDGRNRDRDVGGDVE